MKNNRFMLFVIVILIIVFTFLCILAFGSNVSVPIEGSETASVSEQSNTSQAEASQPLPQTSDIEAMSDVQSEHSDEPSIEPSVEENSTVHFLACPDNIIHTSVYCDAFIRQNGTTPTQSSLGSGDYDFASIYEFVADEIKNADISYINVETLIGGQSKRISGYPTFNTPEAAGQTLCDLGFDVFNLAHNHMLDSGNDSYLKFCNEFFTSKGKTAIGYYKDSADTENIKIVESNGIKIAFLTYTYGTNGIELDSSVKTHIPFFDKKLVRKQVEIAKKNADVIIASCHWGTENSYKLSTMQKEYASFLAELNVDVILGMHPHVIQPMKWEERPDGKKALVVYSLGNFISGMQSTFNTLGGMLSLDIVKAADGDITLENVVFEPIVTHYESGKSVISNDTGYRNFKIYYLKDYTEDLAKRHGVVIWEKANSSTLEGGKFSIANLKNTVEKYIPEEFRR